MSSLDNYKMAHTPDKIIQIKDKSGKLLKGVVLDSDKGCIKVFDTWGQDVRHSTELEFHRCVYP